MERSLHIGQRAIKLGALVLFFSLALCLALAAVKETAGQSRSSQAGRPAQTYAGERTPDGKPNLNGIWQVLNTANWDLRAHAAAPGTAVVELGAIGAEPPGLDVVEGNAIPYQPWAATKQKENAAHWLTADPELKCYLPGIPRATYLPYPFQIVQTPKYVLFAYQYDSVSRTIPLAPKKTDSPVDTWMGDPYGRWDGDTLVIDVTSFNEETWFDRAGDFHSDALHVVERYTPVNRDVLMYEATIEDSKVFTRPWKISMPLYRHVEKNAQLLEFKCIEFAEEMLYGHLRKKTAK
jgi:hypothetical protein